MYPISDLTTYCRKTSGDVPPKLVGASTTAVGSKMYLYGGRLVAERKMVTDIYMFDFETFHWERIPQGPENDLPRARYFHSTEAWNNHLVVFGGMALQPDSSNPEELCSLNDVRYFNLATRRWLPATSVPNDSTAPKARYAHLSSITGDRLFIIGGQDLLGVWLDDIYVYDLRKQCWVYRRDYPRHCGTYRSAAVSGTTIVRNPQDEVRPNSTSKIGPLGSRYAKSSGARQDCTPSDTLVHQPYTTTPTESHPSEIYLFSNYNFTNVQRELEVFKPHPTQEFTIADQSSSMTGNSFPPGLRFPTGAIIGTHFIVAGTYLTQSYQSFSIWALDLTTMAWSRIDPGSALSTGSWFRSCLWSEANKFFVFGNANGNLAADYNRRLLSWDHVACIDLEAFGIYQYPPLLLSIENQELGLAALEEGFMADFDIICDDGRKISCSRKVLEERWPWFKQQRLAFLQATDKVIEGLPAQDAPLPEFPNYTKGSRPDPRLTPRSFQFSESYPIALAFLQYLYSQALITPLQHAPAVLSQLLLLSSTYNISHLQSLAKHAMHRALTYATSVGIYGVSTLCNCRSLQIRALRVVMAYSQKRPSKQVTKEKDGPGGSSGSARDTPGSSGGPGNGGAGTGSDNTGAARPRGMSDASFIQRGTGANDSNLAGGNARGYISSDSGLGDDEETSVIQHRERGVFANHWDPNSIQLWAGINDLPAPQISTTQPSPSPLLKQTSSERIKALYFQRDRSYPPSPRSFASPIDSPALPSSGDPSPFSSPAIPSKTLTSISDDTLFTVPKPSARKSRPAARLNIPRSGDQAHERTLSVLSVNTEDDINALVDMMSPIITEFSHVPNEHDIIEEVDRETLEVHVQTPTVESAPPSVYGGDSESETMSDDFCDRAYLSPMSTTYPAFHLPSPLSITAAYRDSDTPSLSSTSSLSSTPVHNLSHSAHNFHSPPITPAASEFGLNGLAMIEEQESDYEPELDSPQFHPHSAFAGMTFAPPDPNEYPPAKPLELQPVEENYISMRSSTTSPTDTITSRAPRHSQSFDSNRMNLGLGTPTTPRNRSSSAFAKFLGATPRSPKHKDSFLQSPPSWTRHAYGMPINDSVLSVAESTFSAKSLKAEEKRAKKEAAKAKREQMAAELKAKRKAEEERASLKAKKVPKPAPIMSVPMVFSV